MKFTSEQGCDCGGRYVFSAYGNADFGIAQCSICEKPGHMMDPLSVSVTAERLLYRSKAELEGGDFSLAIVIGTMAIESYVTRLFLKLKKMDNYSAAFNLPTPAQEAEWEKEYPRKGGFSRPINFVSTKVTGMAFDKFVDRNVVATEIFSTLPNKSLLGPTQYIQDELFRRRNRVAHWGYVNSSQEEAELCLTIAVAAVAILREMDRVKYGVF